MASTIPLPVPSTSVGFTCKIWMAYQLETLDFGARYYVWFSTELNPLLNGDSSNPLDLYRTIDRAVKKSDINHTKLKDLKARLLWVVSHYIAPTNPSRARLLQYEILNADVKMYRPQLWRIDLSKVHPSRWNKAGARPGWDEQFVTDLRDHEFEIIVA